ncbi:type II toxin-antitoxin system death-on-curing family toxin [soil metagenome]
MSRSEPTWLNYAIVSTLHSEQIRTHGGSPGVRDRGLIESALARPLQRWTYDESADLANLAASYGFGLAKNHGFVDGNKRVAFMALYVFLGLNGRDLDAPEPEVVSVMLAVAGGELGEDELAAWVRERWVEAEE